MIRLKKAELTPEGITKAIYEVSKSTPGRDGITVSHEVSCNVAPLPGYTSMTMHIQCEAETTDSAMDKLAVHLELMSKALREREETSALPIFQ